MIYPTPTWHPTPPLHDPPPVWHTSPHPYMTHPPQIILYKESNHNSWHHSVSGLGRSNIINLPISPTMTYPHPYMTHSTLHDRPTPGWHTPPHPCMTYPTPPLHDPPHPTPTWATPPLYEPPHPFMTHPTPLLHDPPPPHPHLYAL